MGYKSVGTYEAKMIGSKSFDSNGVSGNARNITLDAAGIASGGAFLTSELEKKDMLVREPLTSFTYARDIPIRVGGGWAESVSAMQVGYGVTGGSEDGVVHAGGANDIPIIQADFGKDVWKTHIFSIGMRVMWIDMQRDNMTGRSMDQLLREGIRMAYDKHMDANAYAGIKRYGSTGLINNADITVTNSADNGSGSTLLVDKTPDQILELINDAILDAWEACENDLTAVPNHVVMPYKQYNYIATHKVSDLADKTILNFLLENNVAKNYGESLFIGGTNWCKGAGAGGTDRMAVYCNKERFVAMDELAPLNRIMTQPNATNVCYDSAYMANLSEVQTFYDQSITYVDGI